MGRSAISKKFDGRHNMTLETLADLAFALDRPVKIALPERAASRLPGESTESLPEPDGEEARAFPPLADHLHAPRD